MKKQTETVTSFNSKKLSQHINKQFVKYNQLFQIRFGVSSLGKGHYVEAITTGRKALKGDAVWMTWNDIEKKVGVK